MTKSPKILYAVQATGNGHLSRCMELYPALSEYAEVDVLLSGIQGDLELPFPVKYRFHGWGYVFGKKGGVDYWATAKSLKPLRFLRDALALDLTEYDLVVNDFEPISAYARKWRYKDMHCVALSHQASFFSEKIPRPKRRSWLAEFLFKYFAPSTAKIGFHFQAYDKGVYTPVIRRDIRELEITYHAKEVLVYLPSFTSDPLIEVFNQIPDYQFTIFSKHEKEVYAKENVQVYPVDKENWMESLKKASYAILGAGFQGVSEMLYLNKKILAIPMLSQYEQKCNAQALTQMGVHILPMIKKDFVNILTDWLTTAQVVEVDFPNHSDEIAREVLRLGGFQDRL